MHPVFLIQRAPTTVSSASRQVVKIQPEDIIRFLGEQHGRVTPQASTIHFLEMHPVFLIQRAPTTVSSASRQVVKIQPVFLIVSLAELPGPLIRWAPITPSLGTTPAGGTPRVAAILILVRSQVIPTPQ